MPVSVSGNVSDERQAVCATGARGAGWVGGLDEHGTRPAARSPSSRQTPTNPLTLTPSPTRPAIRVPALRVARNYPASAR